MSRKGDDHVLISLLYIKKVKLTAFLKSRHADRYKGFFKDKESRDLTIIQTFKKVVKRRKKVVPLKWALKISPIY